MSVVVITGAGQGQGGWADLAKDLAERYGRVHGLVANAGLTWRARLLDATAADLHRLHEVNVTGALLAIQAIAPLITAGGPPRQASFISGAEIPVDGRPRRWLVRRPAWRQLGHNERDHRVRVLSRQLRVEPRGRGHPEQRRADRRGGPGLPPHQGGGRPRRGRWHG
jgi:NAD(P)-dependent dehydrogenase (short-subunit alcohol dehydrogenase family)